jgi:hypothetical protein
MLLWSLFKIACLGHKTSKSLDALHKTWRKLYDGTVLFLMRNLLELFQCSADNELNASPK